MSVNKISYTKLYVMFFFLFYVSSGCVSNSVRKECRLIDKEKAKQIAVSEVQRSGYDLNSMKVGYIKIFDGDSLDSIKKANLGWDNIPEIISKLKGRTFWAVLYCQKEPVLGGTFWVFIDSTDGKIITIMKGK